MDPEMSDVKNRTRSSNARKTADGCYLAIRARKVTRLEDQVKGYIMKLDLWCTKVVPVLQKTVGRSCPSGVLRVLELWARTILETASVLAIAMWISGSGEFAKE